MSGLSRQGANLAVVFVIFASCALSTCWAFHVPIYQVPDEPHHLDYALCLSEAHRLFRAKDVPDDVIPLYIVHPWTIALLDRLEMNSYYTSQPPYPMSPEYGTPAFLEELNRSLPAREDIVIDQTPSILRIYPFGYYALVAGWIEFVRLFDGRFTTVFYAARMLSVLLLAVSLLCTYGILRELGRSRSFSLLLTLIVGTFPLTSFISCYVQPDNLCLCLVSSTMLACLRGRRSAWSIRWSAVLGMSLGMLSVTKLHFFLCAALPVAALLVHEWIRHAELRRRLLLRGGLFVLPTLILCSIHAWTVQGSTNYFIPTAEYDNFLLFVIRGFANALRDYYWRAAHRSFWGVFGWMDTPINFGSPWLNSGMNALIRLVTATLLILSLVRLVRLMRTFKRMAWAGHARWAFGLAVSNPVLNGYFMFTVLMIALYIRLDNRFGAQGRNWFPMIMPVFLAGAVFAPGAIRNRQVRRLVGGGILAGLLLYCAVGGIASWLTIKNRYYPEYREQPMCQRILPIREAVHEVGAEETTLGQSWELPEGPHVYGVRIRFVLDDFSERQHAVRLAWCGCADESDQKKTKQVLYWMKPTAVEQTATFWPNDDITSFRFVVDQSTGIEVREVTLLQRP